VPPETGKFIALLAANAPKGDWLEIGTSAGYSALWLAVASEVSGCSIDTFEILPEKAKLARETFRLAKVERLVKLAEGDARSYVSNYHNIGCCFQDAEKEVYGECYEVIVPNLVKRGVLVADNAINHREILLPVLERALTDERVDSLIVPIGKGVLICRKA